MFIEPPFGNHQFFDTDARPRWSEVLSSGVIEFSSKAKGATHHIVT
jgi:hypothetical protein